MPDILDASPEAFSDADGTASPVRVCVAGAGFARRYAYAFHSDVRAEVVGICAKTAESAAQVTAATGGTSYTDFDRMLEFEKPDVVVVATPNHLHHPMSMSALIGGAAVICEKPLGLDAAQAEEMAAYANALGRKTGTAFTWRFHPGCVAMASLLEHGRLGEIYQVDMRYYTRGFGAVHGPMRWQFDRSAAGSGALANLGSHATDLVHWWLGPISRAAAITRTVIPSRVTEIGDSAVVSVEDVSAVTLELASGAPVSLSLGWVAHIARVGLEVDVHGSEGSARFRYATGANPLGTLTICDEEMTEPAEIGLVGKPNDWVNLGERCVSELVAAFLAPACSTESAMPDFGDGLRAQCVIDAILKAAATRSWVDVDYPAEAARIGPRFADQSGGAA